MKKQKTQILLIHGGMTFKNKKDYMHYLKTRTISIEKKPYWSEEYFDKTLGKQYQIIRPRMPNKEDAKYKEWKINFEKHFPHLKNNIVLIGVSLGGIFLAKYLSEHKFPKKILSTYLVAPPFDNTLSSSGEYLAGGFKLGKNLALIEKQSKHVHLLFSKNDDCVPPSHAEKYRKKLKNAHIVIYPHIKGHFRVSRFPELVKMIREDVQGKKYEV